jgi:hypothetical protein
MSVDNLTELKNILAKDDSLDEESLQKAAYELLTRQFLFREKNRQRRYFHLISNHQSYFRRLMKATGHNLVVEERNGYVGIIPTSFSRQMTIEETLLLLVIRNIYDEEIQNFNAKENGSVEIEVEDFMLKYEAMTGRERPQSKKDFINLINPMIRFGILKEFRDLEHNDAWVLRIYPSITALVNGDSLQLIEAHMQARNIDTQPKEAME